MESWVWFTYVHDWGMPSIHTCLQWHTEATPWPSNLRLSLLRRGEQTAAAFILLLSLFEEPADLSQFMRRVTHFSKHLQHVCQTNNAPLAASTSTSSSLR